MKLIKLIRFASWVYDLSSINIIPFDYNNDQNDRRKNIKNKDSKNLRDKISSKTGAVDLSGYIENSG